MQSNIIGTLLTFIILVFLYYPMQILAADITSTNIVNTIYGTMGADERRRGYATW
jgi:hypothetical protein